MEVLGDPDLAPLSQSNESLGAKLLLSGVLLASALQALRASLADEHSIVQVRKTT